MNRRDTIKGIALSLGYALAAPSVMSVLESCTTKNKNWSAVYFSREEQHFVTYLVDIILPSTETPGGLDVNLPQFIDMMSEDMFGPEEKQSLKKAAKFLPIDSVKSSLKV